MPSNIGSVVGAAPLARVNSCTAPATYAVPTARCSALVSRAAVAVPHAAFGAPNQSSCDGAFESPGVHSVLKKLWLAPITSTELLSAVSPSARPREASVNCWPWRSETSPSQ